MDDFRQFMFSTVLFTIMVITLWFGYFDGTFDIWMPLGVTLAYVTLYGIVFTKYKIVRKQ